MLLQQPDRCLYLLMLFFIAQEVAAQDIVYFMDNTKVETKVLEVGLDSIKHLPTTKKDTPPVSIPRAFVKYIQYKNGQRYFIDHSKLYLVNGKIVLAYIQKSTDKVVRYQDVYTHQEKTVPLKKVVAIHYDTDEKVNYLDKINLWSGQFMAGKVLQVKEESVIFENVARRNREQTIDIARVRSIEFKNGFEQEFSSTQPNE